MWTYALSVLCWGLVMTVGVVVGTWYPDDIWCDLVLICIAFLIRSLSKRYELVLLYTLQTPATSTTNNWPLITYTLDILRQHPCMCMLMQKTEELYDIQPGDFSTHVASDQSVCKLAIVAASTCATLIMFMTRSSYVFWIVRSLCGFEWATAAFLVQHEPLLCVSAVKESKDFTILSNLWNPFCWQCCIYKYGTSSFRSMIVYAFSFGSSAIVSSMALWGYLNVSSFAYTYHMQTEYLAAFLALTISQFVFYSVETDNTRICSSTGASCQTLLYHVGCVSLMRSLVHVFTFSITHIFYENVDMPAVVMTIVSVSAGVFDTWLVNRIGYVFCIINDKTFSDNLYFFVGFMIQTNIIADVLAQFIFFDHYVNGLRQGTSIEYAFTTMWTLVFCSSSLCAWSMFKE